MSSRDASGFGGTKGPSVQAIQAPLEVALVEPEIPPNTGNVARTCAAVHVPLHLVEPLGFRLTDRYLKRAGLDYWPYVNVTVHRSLQHFLRHMEGRRLLFFSKKASLDYDAFVYMPGDCLVFGSETQGLPAWLLEAHADRALRIPMDSAHVRSLNLATAVGIALFEARRQIKGQLAPSRPQAALSL
ncbi:tRNA (cytidine(34)-2'-O)-methyltransferase [Desulfosoma caldarium]|uniref:Putative tRNA (cytidine(34)-2'-O)-methyltransferase n=1 Tax=Desulfosoma caldarium TaxID=610254 RepID=A0A3N1UXY1_9BACT|nr:tRNA (cytidine(34)-2'-O)-methyltransferase [Desulfosoma caldarium]ROQ92116.1 tRNA (cytidine/uridine-2'-O-)-methyltransferase [Desulfosoma caldarium]